MKICYFLTGCGATSVSNGPNSLPATATVATSSSVQNLVDSCVSVLVTLHKETILSECADMIRANETEKLQLMVSQTMNFVTEMLEAKHISGKRYFGLLR